MPTRIFWQNVKNLLQNKFFGLYIPARMYVLQVWDYGKKNKRRYGKNKAADFAVCP